MSRGLDIGSSLWSVKATNRAGSFLPQFKSSGEWLPLQEKTYERNCNQVNNIDCTVMYGSSLETARARGDTAYPG